MSYKKIDITLPPNKNFSPKTSFRNQKEYYQALNNNTDLAKSFDFSMPENFLYTRANLTRDFIQPNKSKLRLISENKDKEISALNFVVDAYEDFRTFVKNKKFKKLVDDPIIKKDWCAVVGWQDLDIFYGKRMNEVYQSFVRQYLQPSQKEREIKNFDDFLNIFMNNYFGQINIPITKSGFMNSRNIGPNFSGLCLQISQADVTTYSNKYNNFVNSKNFEVFSLAAAQFGFMLDYHVPWRLVANLNSPKLFPYIQDRANVVFLESETQKTFGFSPPHQHSYSVDENLNGYTTPPINVAESVVPPHVHEIISGEVKQAQYYSDEIPNTSHIHDVSYNDNYSLTPSDIYGIYFNKTSALDIETLKVYLVDMYNTFSNNIPVSLFKVDCGNSQDYSSLFGSQKRVTRQISRSPTSLEEINEQYEKSFWYKLYFNIRLKEVGAKISDEKRAYAIRKMEEYYFFVDKDRALRYINDYLKQYY